MTENSTELSSLLQFFKQTTRIPTISKLNRLRCLRHRPFSSAASHTPFANDKERFGLRISDSRCSLIHSEEMIFVGEKKRFLVSFGRQYLYLYDTICFRMTTFTPAAMTRYLDMPLSSRTVQRGSIIQITRSQNRWKILLIQFSLILTSVFIFWKLESPLNCLNHVLVPCWTGGVQLTSCCLMFRSTKKRA